MFSPFCVCQFHLNNIYVSEEEIELQKKKQILGSSQQIQRHCHDSCLIHGLKYFLFYLDEGIHLTQSKSFHPDDIYKLSVSQCMVRKDKKEKICLSEKTKRENLPVSPYYSEFQGPVFIW